MALRYAVSLHISSLSHAGTDLLQRFGGLHSTRTLGTSSRSRPIKLSPFLAQRFLASQSTKEPGTEIPPASEPSSPSLPAESSKSPGTLKPSPTSTPPSDWEENPNYSISQFSELPHSNFGVNQHIVINDEFKEALRQILWQFRAPIRYAFAYGSGVFPQSKPVRECQMESLDNRLFLLFLVPELAFGHLSWLAIRLMTMASNCLFTLHHSSLGQYIITSLKQQCADMTI